jgi:hypothetical protein
MRLLEQKAKQGEITGLIMSVQKQQMKRIKHIEKLLKTRYTRNSKDIYKEKRRQEKKIHRQKEKPFLEEQLK